MEVMGKTLNVLIVHQFTTTTHQETDLM